MIDIDDALVIKDGNVFLLAPRAGLVPVGERHPYGLWMNDCRFLCLPRLAVDGRELAPAGGTDESGTDSLHELTDPHGELDVRVARRVEARGALRERIAVTSGRDHPAQVTLEVRFEADFLPMLELRGLVPERRRAVSFETGVLQTTGRDGVRRSTAVSAAPEPARAEDGALVFRLALPARGSAEVAIDFDLSEQGGRAAPRVSTARPEPADRTRVATDDPRFDRILRRSLGDLDMLRSELDGSTYYAAGLPWFATLFGRDSLISAFQMLAFEPATAEGTLRALAARLGRASDDEHDEDPGKVIHELRVGEPAALRETPFARYYGSADGTPLFLCLLCAHADWSGSLDLFRELRAPAAAALEWIDRHGDLDGDGLVEYERRSPRGLVTQGWKDSPTGVPDAEGVPLRAPVALVEVQGYVAHAKRGMARLFELDGEGRRGERLRREAAELEHRLERFWLEDERSYAIGLDAGKRPGSGGTSNQGHLLWAGAVAEERAQAIRDRLMSPELFSGWGVRTLAAGHPAFDPLGYHTGSVWPHDNALIAAGMRRYGFDSEFSRVFAALLDAASGFGEGRLPELFGGFAREAGEGPVPYPVACRPQAWAAGSIPYLLSSSLGLRPDALRGRLEIVRPLLPPGVTHLELTAMRVGGASVDLRFERADDGAVVADARVRGALELVT